LAVLAEAQCVLHAWLRSGNNWEFPFYVRMEGKAVLPRRVKDPSGAPGFYTSEESISLPPKASRPTRPIARGIPESSE
jgi:hypothetical protein